MTAEVAYDASVRPRANWTNYVAAEKEGRGGSVDVRSTGEYPPAYFVVIRVDGDVVLFSIADLMNRPPERHR